MADCVFFNLTPECCSCNAPLAQGLPDELSEQCCGSQAPKEQERWQQGWPNGSLGLIRHLLALVFGQPKRTQQRSA